MKFVSNSSYTKFPTIWERIAYRLFLLKMGIYWKYFRIKFKIKRKIHYCLYHVKKYWQQSYGFSR